MTLWYYETVTMTGRWSPCTAPEKPDSATQGGHLRLRMVSGYGPRIRRIVEVPAGLADLLLNDLREALWGDGEEAAVSRPLGEAA